MRHVLASKIAKLKLRIARGESYTYWFYRSLALATFLKIWDLHMSLIIVVVIVFMALLYAIGLMDEKYFKIWQKENDYSIKKLNPYLDRKLSK